MDNGNYVRIDYNPDAPEDVSVTEYKKQAQTSTKTSDQNQTASKTENMRNDYMEMAEIERAATAELAEEVAKMMREEAEESEAKESEAATTEYKSEDVSRSEKKAEENKSFNYNYDFWGNNAKEEPEDLTSEVTSEDAGDKLEESVEDALDEMFQKSTSEEVASEEAASEEVVSEEVVSEEVVSEEVVSEEVVSEEPVSEEPAPASVLTDEVKEIMAEYTAGIDKMNRTMTRLERKFSDEILNAENRDNMVKTIYKELNDYKAGLIEKALKNVLYDLIDLRETMLSQMKYLKEKKGLESISIDEFESYANDIGDILEKHDVTIYKGTPGEENVAVKQKIVRKVPTEDPEMVKKVAESLSYGYEYNSKVIYPEKISIYIKK